MDNSTRIMRLQKENEDLTYKNDCYKAMIDFLLNEIKDHENEKTLKP